MSNGICKNENKLRPDFHPFLMDRKFVLKVKGIGVYILGPYQTAIIMKILLKKNFLISNLILIKLHKKNIKKLSYMAKLIPIMLII